MEDYTLDILTEPTEDMADENKEKKVLTEAPKKQRGNFKTMECKVISYNKNSRTLDVKFNKYGIRIKDVDFNDGDSVTVKYKGEIGKPNFIYKI